MTQTRKKRLLWALCLAALALFAAAMVWLHYQQLCATGRGEDPYTSDLGQHLYFAQSGLIYSATSLPMPRAASWALRCCLPCFIWPLWLCLPGG